MAWQAASVAEVRGIHPDGIDVAVVDPLLLNGDGLKLIGEMRVANPDARALVLSHKPDEAVYHRAFGVVGAADVLFTTNASLEEIINAVRGVGTTAQARKGGA